MVHRGDFSQDDWQGLDSRPWVVWACFTLLFLLVLTFGGMLMEEAEDAQLVGSGQKLVNFPGGGARLVPISKVQELFLLLPEWGLGVCTLVLLGAASGGLLFSSSKVRLGYFLFGSFLMLLLMASFLW